MLKILGMFLVILACGGIGVSKAQKYAARPIHLRKICSALQNLETEIAWTATPLPEALDRVGKMIGMPVGYMFTQAGTLIAENNYISVAQAWEEALVKSKPYLAINYEEIEVLKGFGNGLGISQLEDQVKNLTLTREHLKNIEMNAEEERIKYEKLYKTMGFLIGIAIALILI